MVLNIILFIGNEMLLYYKINNTQYINNSQWHIHIRDYNNVSTFGSIEYK